MKSENASGGVMGEEERRRHECPTRCHVCPDCDGEVMPWCWGTVASGDYEDCICPDGVEIPETYQPGRAVKTTSVELPLAPLRLVHSREEVVNG